MTIAPIMLLMLDLDKTWRAYHERWNGRSCASGHSTILAMLVMCHRVSVRRKRLVWPQIERQAFMNTGLTSGKMGAKPSLSAIDFGQRRSPLKSGISRTAGKCRWSTTVERTLVAQIAIIETPVKGETASNPPPIEPNALT
jgi:hypothetical protein